MVCKILSFFCNFVVIKKVTRQWLFGKECNESLELGYLNLYVTVPLQ
jgi:hypothetical protein